jgi:hypothetical protein
LLTNLDCRNCECNQDSATPGRPATELGHGKLGTDTVAGRHANPDEWSLDRDFPARRVCQINLETDRRRDN